ncbi:MAG: hypothetical protein WAX69_14385 [Victivallales bacterium]
MLGRITIATTIPSQREAEDLVGRLRKELGLKEDADGLIQREDT